MSDGCITIAEFMGFFCPTFSTTGCTSSGGIVFAVAGTAGDTITIGTLVATAVAGARVAGSLTWTVGASAVLSATNFAAMLADSLFSEIVSATRSSTAIALATIAKGYASLLALATSNAAAYTLTAFAGGTTMVDTILASVCRLIGSCFGSQRTIAQYWLAAHMLAGGKGQDVGTQTAAAINAISAGFAATPYGPADAVFSNTQYGRQFLLVRSMVPRLGFATVIPDGSGCGC